MLHTAGVAVALRRDVVFRCAYEVVWCPERRRPVLGGRIEERLKDIVREVAAEKGAGLTAVEVMPGHVHPRRERGSRFGVPRLLEAVEGRSSRLLRAEFGQLRSRLPTPGTHSSFVATTGGAPRAAITRYVEQQKGR